MLALQMVITLPTCTELAEVVNHDVVVGFNTTWDLRKGSDDDLRDRGYHRLSG